MAKKNIFSSIFGSDPDAGFVDYANQGYDASSSAVTEEEADFVDYEDDSREVTNYNSSKFLNMHNTVKEPTLCIMKPSGYDEVMSDAVRILREGSIIFLNLNGIGTEIGTRIVDFMTGVAAAVDGRIKKVDTCCYAIAPKGVDWIGKIDD